MGEPQTYFLETLGCPKNQVDSDKLEGRFAADGMTPVDSPDEADIVVVNTCAFIDEARQESVDTILSLSDQRREGAKLVVTGCMAERHGDEIADSLPEVDQVAPFGIDITGSTAVPVSLGPTRRAPDFDLLNLPRPASARPWSYVKIAEGCDRACGFCAIPTFRGPQRSRSIDQILTEVDELQAREIVLVAQDLAAYGRDQGVGERSIIPLVRQIADRVDRVRLLYLYPSDLTDALIDTICDTGVPYFDLSLQHVSPPLMRRMRRWGDGERFLRRITDIRAREPEAAFRSNFIVGYPGETEDDHDALLDFVEQAQLDWCGFFAYSPEAGTYAMELDGEIDTGLRDERLPELRELQDDITGAKRDLLVGSEVRVLVDEPGIGRSHREAPEIDGVVVVPDTLEVGDFHDLTVTATMGPDVEAS
ncbi:MAG TPA: 30S ribosomal protein S12 methylthiotransferase RimO [Acidimicrobiaceae bacterium]|nr:30S ribosomal protein S12 methylthiotransferase RimO [Acidimicrobiaceae bacterium]